MTLRPYLVPTSLGIGLIGLCYALAYLIEGPAGLLLFAASFLGLPLLVGGFERDRIPQGKWWIAPIFAAIGSLILLLCLAAYALSRI